MSYVFTFNLDPQTKERPRFDPRSKRTYTSNKTRTYETLLASMARAQIAKMPEFSLLEGALEVSIVFLFERPKTANRAFKTTKPDLDNLIKAIDSFNGIIWKDDCQIVQIHAKKSYASGRGEIYMTVREVIDEPAQAS